MTPDEAILAFRNRMAADTDSLAIDVLERLALRGCGKEWAVFVANGAVRLFRKPPIGDHVSRYVWALEGIDHVIDILDPPCLPV